MKKTEFEVECAYCGEKVNVNDLPIHVKRHIQKEKRLARKLAKSQANDNSHTKEASEND